MPTTIAELADDTAFERLVLDRMFPLMPSSDGAAAVIDLDAAGPVGVAVSFSISDSMGSSTGQMSLDKVRPLVFGAAWKVLDLIVELALERANVAYDRGNHYTIALKAQRAVSGQVPAVPPLDTHQKVWQQVTATYAAMQQVRHSLVHRQLIVESSSGAISATPPSTPVTADEQAAFCQLATGTVSAVLAAALPKRHASQLRWNLDQLGTHHGHQQFGDPPANGLIPRIVVRPTVSPEGEVMLDLATIRASVAPVRDGSYYDLELHLPERQNSRRPTRRHTRDNREHLDLRPTSMAAMDMNTRSLFGTVASGRCDRVASTGRP